MLTEKHLIAVYFILIFSNYCTCCSRSKRFTDEKSIKDNKLNSLIIFKTDNFISTAEEQKQDNLFIKPDHIYCDKTNDNIYCYNNGTCLVKLFEINITHTERITYCECQKVNFELFI